MRKENVDRLIPVANTSTGDVYVTTPWLGIDGFHSIFHCRNWRAKRSCDTLSKQHGDALQLL